MPVKAALAGGLALIAAALVLTLAHAPLTVAKTTVPPATQFTATTSSSGGCQRDELLPPDTTAIRLGLFAVTTPAVAVKVFAGPHVLTEGTLAPGWSGEGATVPVNKVLARASSPVTVCFALTSVTGTVEMVGKTTSSAEATAGGGRPLPGRISIEYLRPSRRSWWSLAGSVARRLGLGRADSGIGNALLVIALALTVLTLSSWLVVKDLR
jgi:hypothetical protein